MGLNGNNSVAELRTELERKRRRALDLQMQTTDQDEWSSLNEIRWELEDLDNDLYQSQFIKNNEKLEKLINQINEATGEAIKIVTTLNEAKLAVQSARGKLKQASCMFTELDAYLQGCRGND